MRRGKRIGRTAACAVLAVLCTACGSAAGEKISLSIQDGPVETVIEVPAGETVAQILGEAEILLHEADVVTPDLDEAVTAEDESIRIDRSVTVTVEDRDSAQELTITGGTVSDALAAADITLNEHDQLNHDPEAALTEGMEIAVDRWYGVTLVTRETRVVGENVEVRTSEEQVVTQAETVRDLLEEQGIALEEGDQMDQKKKKKVKDGLTVTISRANRVRETEEEEIGYETVYEDSSDLYEGETRVKQEGGNGVKEYVYEITYVDGAEEKRDLVRETVTKEATDEIIQRGTKKREAETSAASSSGSSQSSGSSGSSKSSEKTEKTEVSRKAVYDCDGSGHGYYIITYSDGSEEYEDF